MSGVRLRPLVEVVEQPDGTLYLLRGPAGGDCVIRTPPPGAVALVRALERGGSVPELARDMAAHGHALPERDVGTMVGELAAAGLIEPAVPHDVDARLGRQLLYLRERMPAGSDAAELQHRVASAHVVILGCGGLGSWAATGLACIGVGRLTLVDDDRVELSNLNRQLLFTEADVGRLKVDAAADALLAFNSSLTVDRVPQRIESAEAVRALVAGASLVLGLADRPPYKIARWINAGCLRERVPHLSAGQLPPTVRVGPLVVPGETACTSCLELHLREENPLYDQLEALRAADARPLATLGPASGVAGSVIAMDVLHHLTGLAPAATRGAVWTLDLRTLASERSLVARRDDCAECGGSGR